MGWVRAVFNVHFLAAEQKIREAISKERDAEKEERMVSVVRFILIIIIVSISGSRGGAGYT